MFSSLFIYLFTFRNDMLIVFVCLRGKAERKDWKSYLLHDTAVFFIFILFCIFLRNIESGFLSWAQT